MFMFWYKKNDKTEKKYVAHTNVSITSKAAFVLGQTSLGCDTVTPQQEMTQHQTFGPCNCFYCLGYSKMSMMIMMNNEVSTQTRLHLKLTVPT